jgi:Calcineurin-like phosphoesterase
MRARTWLLGLLVVVVAIVAVVLIRRTLPHSGSLAPPAVLPSLPASSASAQPRILLAAGDTASCDSPADDAVANLASRLPGTIALLGDTVYESGTAEEYRDCFDPVWGPMKARIRPAPGNHEYRTDGTDYFDYFGTAAGPRDKGWYSYDLGAWHVVVLNSNCPPVSCASDGDQVRWLEADLAAHPSECLLGYWHFPRWSSGRHGSQEVVDPIWRLMADHGADVVLNGHDHTYERIRADGIRQFVVGTGGRSHYPFERGPLPTTEVRNDSTYGLLWLALGEGTYEWEFLGLGDTGFTDSGQGTC